MPDQIRRDEGKGTGGIVLGTEVPGVGFKLLYQGSSWARESLARVWVGLNVWRADMFGWLDGWMNDRC